MTNLERKSLSIAPSSLDLAGLVAYYQKQLKEEAFIYLQKRGLSEQTVEQFQIGFEIGKIGFYVDQNQLGGYFENRVIIPLFDKDKEIVDLIGRSIDHREPKYKALYGTDQILFNYEAITESDEVVLCNGIFDVMTLVQAKIPAVCVPDLIVFKENHAKLFADKSVYICMGNDELGRRESTRIESLLREHAKETYIVNLPETIRDINDLFVRAQNPAENFIRLIQQTVEETMVAPIAPDAKNSTVYVEEYMKRYRGQVSGITTGFPKLDQLLFGGFGSGLYLLAGEGGIGKSMLLKQMADHIALEQNPVVFVSWDMTNFELWSRSIARIIGIPPQLVLSGKVEPEPIHEANKTYMQISKMLWMLECSMDTTLAQVASSIERIAVIAGKEPVVFLDHLQRIPIPVGEKVATLSWQQQQSALAYALKQWSREWNSPIIAATALEAGQDRIPQGVEASADVVMMLQRAESADPAIQWMQLDLIKNRNGSLNKIPIQFYNDRAIFTE
jgi:replicative DNA helicase